MDKDKKYEININLAKLKARKFLIEANIMFGKDFLDNNLNDITKTNEISNLTEQQTNYKKEVDSLAKIINDRCSKNNPNGKEILDFAKKPEILLGDSRNNSLIIKLHELNQNKIELDIDHNINDTMTELSKIKDKVSQEKINIVVIGKRGSGKSSFINEFFDKHNFEENVVETNEVECTLNPKIYDYRYFYSNMTENEHYNRIRIWDFPGAGTENFPLEEYV